MIPQIVHNGGAQINWKEPKKNPFPTGETLKMRGPTGCNKNLFLKLVTTDHGDRHEIWVCYCCGADNLLKKEIVRGTCCICGADNLFQMQMIQAFNDSIDQKVCFWTDCTNSSALMRCKKCKRATYCCRNHQKKHWPQHKPLCY